MPNYAWLKKTDYLDVGDLGMEITEEKSDAKSGAVVAKLGDTGDGPISEIPEFSGVCYQPVGGDGLEPQQKSAGNRAKSSLGDAKSDAVDSELGILLEIWPQLSVTARKRILRLAIEQTMDAKSIGIHRPIFVAAGSCLLQLLNFEIGTVPG